MLKVGRNDPCPCGSGRKYKRCCLSSAAPPLPAAPQRPARGVVPPEAVTWPIVRVYAPVADVWRATGLGAVFVERRRPDGRSAWSMFKLDLRAGGIELAAGDPDDTAASVEKTLSLMGLHFPPFESSTPEVASAYLWGAWAYGEASGDPLPPGAEGYLAMVPPPPGSEADWLAHLVGPGGLTPAELVEVIEAQPPEIEEGDQMEVALATTMWFDVDDAERAASLLEASPPEHRGYRFVRRPPPAGGERVHLDFARPIPKGPRSMMPVRGGLQLQGYVQFDGDEMIAFAMTSSMAAKLVQCLRAVLGGGSMRLKEAAWVGAGELAEEARTEPGIRRLLKA